MIGHMLGAGDPHSTHTTGHQLYQNKLYCVYFENDMQAGKGTSWERAVGSQDSEEEDRLYHLLSYCVQHLSCFFIAYNFLGKPFFGGRARSREGRDEPWPRAPSTRPAGPAPGEEIIEKRTLDYDVKPRAGSCRGAPVRARPDLPPRGWKGSPPPGRRAVATHKKA